MNEEAIRGIAETAFKDRFALEVVRINVKPDVSHYGDPVVDVQIVYDDKRGKVGRLNDEGFFRLPALGSGYAGLGESE